jgi:hypothetical protein
MVAADPVNKLHVCYIQACFQGGRSWHKIANFYFLHAPLAKRFFFLMRQHFEVYLTRHDADLILGALLQDFLIGIRASTSMGKPVSQGNASKKKCRDELRGVHDQLINTLDITQNRIILCQLISGGYCSYREIIFIFRVNNCCGGSRSLW